MIRFTALTLFGLSLIALASEARTDEVAEELKLLQGDWVPASAELAGQKLPEEVLKTMKLTVKDDKYVVVAASTNDEGSLKLDIAAKPKTMDIVGTSGPSKGKTIPAIYELSADSLRVCYGLEGASRPTEFKSQPVDKGLILLITYKRPGK